MSDQIPVIPGLYQAMVYEVNHLREERDEALADLAAAQAQLETYRLDKEQENERLAAHVKARLAAEKIVENLVHASMDNTAMKLDLAALRGRVERLAQERDAAYALLRRINSWHPAAQSEWLYWQDLIARLLDAPP
jgi:uncharacterized protein YukE